MTGKRIAAARPQGLSYPQGFTYLGLLMFIAISGIALAAIGQAWHIEAQREKERELLFIGNQFRNAIGSYYQSTPGEVKQYPAALEDLLNDNRFPNARRHLRKIYRDPVTGSAEWGLIKEQGLISGVYSQSKIKPLKQEGFPLEFASFAKAENYANWRFTPLRDAASSSTPPEADMP